MALATRVRIGVGEVVISPKARANVLSALDNNRLSYGPFSREFEQRFCAIHHRAFGTFVNSGTDALRIGLGAMKGHYRWKDGDKVLVPAVTFVASFNVIVQNGLEPVLVDIDDHYAMLPPDRYYMDDRVVAAMPVSLFGQPVDPEVTATARRMGLRVIEDSCETMFVGRSTADVTCYSTYACHLINTGVGGLAVTDDPDLARIIRSLANHGRDGIYTGIDDALGQFEVIKGRFTFERMGYSSRATELEAAIGCAELDVWEERLFKRQLNAKWLATALADLPLTLPVLGGAHMMFPVRTTDEPTRDALVQHLESEGIETRPLLPLTNQPYIKQLFGSDVEDRYPNAKAVNRTGLYVASHPYLTFDDLNTMSGAFHSFFR